MIKIGMSTVALTEALRPSAPIREPIEAVVLFVSDGTHSSLWCELDFMDFNRRVTDTLGKAVSRATGVSRDLVHILTTHNHGGGTPDLDTLAEILASGAERAMNGARAARMRYAFTKSEKQINILRRLYVPELDATGTLYFGAAEENGFNSSLFAESLVTALENGKLSNAMGEHTDRPCVAFSRGDEEIVAVEFVSLEGETIGSLVRFAAHAVCANRPGSYSSDYPYYVRSVMKESLGGEAMFMNGPCAEIAPAMINKLEGREQPLGKYIAETALRALKNAELTEIVGYADGKCEIRLPVRREVLENFVDVSSQMPEELSERKRYLERLGLRRTLPFLYEKYAEGESSLSDTVPIYLGFLRLGELVLVAFPGETFWATGAAVKAAFPDIRICTVTEHERTVMYLPPYDEFLRGGYESICKTTAPESESILRHEAIKKLETFL